jgi:hypothetical protein
MTIKQASELICPFMSYRCALESAGAYETTCITDKCMAWETTKTKAIQDNFFKCTCGQTFDVYRYGFTCQKCGKEHINIETDLPREACEGYCRRLK